MANDQGLVSGTVLSWTPAGGGQSHNAPAKLLIAGAQETFELDIFPVGPKLGGTDAPWTAASKLPAYMDNLPANPVGVSIEAIVGPKKVYNGVPQYKPTQITVLDGNAAAPAAPAQASAGGLPGGVGPRDVWNAEGQARGNSKGVASAIVAAYVTTHQGDLPDADWLTAAAGAVNTFSRALLADGTAVDAPEEQPEEESEVAFGSL